jgi:hypothetical protein
VRIAIYIVDVLSKGKTFNPTHYIEYILESILALRLKYRQRRLIIYGDKATLITVTPSRMSPIIGCLISPYPNL